MKAYSYIRFSSAAQASGDSLRRQLALTRAWCDARGVELVEDYRDLGVSAYRGKNAVQGKLGGFLAAVESGDIPRGSFLIVESLDRITRTELSDALALFLRLINGGVTVVTLGDGAKEYKKATIDASMGDLVMSLVILSRANEESRMKSRRIGEAHKARRMRAAEKGKTEAAGNGPAWLRRDGDKWRVIPERAKGIKKLFAMVADGHSLRVIGDKLLEDGVKPPRGAFWQTRSLRIILRSRAPIGELVMKGADSTPVVIPNHFPAVVTVEQWKAANAHYFTARTRKPGRRNTPNIFSTLVEDGDGNPCHLQQQHRRGRTYAYFLAFTKKEGSSNGKKCGHSKSTGWKLDTLQGLVLDTLPEAMRQLSAAPISEGASPTQALAAELSATEGRIARLVDALADGTLKSAAERLRQEEAKRDELQKKLTAAEMAGEASTPRAWKEIPRNDPARLGAHIRTVLSRVALVDRQTVRVEMRAGFSYVARITPEGVKIAVPKATMERRA